MRPYYLIAYRDKDWLPRAATASIIAWRHATIGFAVARRFTAIGWPIRSAKCDQVRIAAQIAADGPRMFRYECQ